LIQAILEVEVSGTYSKYSKNLRKIFKNNSLESMKFRLKNPRVLDYETCYEPQLGKIE
jgi:hypothetical protein